MLVILLKPLKIDQKTIKLDAKPMNSDVLGSETIEKLGFEAPRIDFSSKNAIFRFPAWYPLISFQAWF